MRWVRTALLLAFLPGIAGLALVHWPPAAFLERTGLDLLFLLRGVRSAPESVCVVAIDDSSYSVLELDAARPLPRALHAQLIRTLAREGARAVAFDILFVDPGDPDQDGALESALRETGIVVLGATVEQVADPRFVEARLVDPFEPFAASAAAVGEVNLPLDRDGVIRYGWLAHGERPSLALAAYEVATGDRSMRRRESRLVDYFGPARTVRTVSVYQALDPTGHLPPGSFRGKVVFVGLSRPAAAGPAEKDAFLTPFRGSGGEQTAGVEIHATIAANLLERSQIALLPAAGETALLLLLPLLASLAFLYLRPLYGGLALVGLELLPWIAGHLAFAYGRTWVPVVIPAVVQLPAAYLSSVLWYYLTTARERERIRRAFSFYLSPEMIARIAENPGSLNLGGEEIVGTALMTDLAGFTSIAERLSPPQTVAMLNTYFSRVTRHVFATGGTLIKFIGDAVFAIWGAPVRIEDHASRACLAAIALAREEERAVPAAGARLVTRIGVHTGPMVVGNLGSEQRFDYTAIGDAVNLASRLEGLNKVFGTRVIVSADTLAATEGRFASRPLGIVTVAGRTEPVAIHELLEERDEATRPDRVGIERFVRALEDFRARRFAAAASGFRAVAADLGGSDGPSEFYLRAIERLEAAPPPSEWDGVVAIESK